MKKIICTKDVAHNCFRVQYSDILLDQNGRVIDPKMLDTYTCHSCGEPAMEVEFAARPRDKYTIDSNTFRTADGLTGDEPTIQGFWNCDCENDFVHQTDTDPFCWRCRMYHGDAADAYVVDVLRFVPLDKFEWYKIACALYEHYNKETHE